MIDMIQSGLLVLMIDHHGTGILPEPVPSGVFFPGIISLEFLVVCRDQRFKAVF
jgi:hypothetical protein